MRNDEDDVVLVTKDGITPESPIWKFFAEIYGEDNVFTDSFKDLERFYRDPKHNTASLVFGTVVWVEDLSPRERKFIIDHAAAEGHQEIEWHEQDHLESGSRDLLPEDRTIDQESRDC